MLVSVPEYSSIWAIFDVGNGTCGERVNNKDGTVTVRCLGPAHSLKPGQTVNTMMYLESPYPSEGQVVVLNLTSQLVDAEEQPVPLSDVGALLAQRSKLLLLALPPCLCVLHMPVDSKKTPCAAAGVRTPLCVL